MYFSILPFVIKKITFVVACCHYKINPEKTISTFRGHRINTDETHFGETLFSYKRRRSCAERRPLTKGRKGSKRQRRTSHEKDGEDECEGGHELAHLERLREFVSLSLR